MAVIPSDLSTKLTSVNVLLSGIGEQPVSSLETTESSLAETAENTLNEFSRICQTKGWFWNTEHKLTLQPNSSNEIELPANTLSVDNAYQRGNGNMKVIERGRKLYNRDDHTFIFTGPVDVDLVIFLQWEDLPEFVRQAIVYDALHRFQMRELTSTSIGQVTEADMIMTMTNLEHKEDEEGAHNQIAGNRDVSNVLSGPRGLRRR